MLEKRPGNIWCGVEIIVPDIFREGCFCFVIGMFETFFVVVVPVFELRLRTADVLCLPPVVVRNGGMIDDISSAALAWYGTG